MNYLISVVNPGAMDRVCEIAAALDLPQTVTLLGHGTAVQSMLDLLGIESTEKRVIMTVANPEKPANSLRKCAGRCISASRDTASSWLSPSKAWEEEKPWHI